MLIGVRRPLSMRNDSFPEDKPEVLLAGDVLVRTNQELDLESLLYDLIVFKEEFDKNERYLVIMCLYYLLFLSLVSFQSSHFVRKVVSCPELIAEISEYLSLNDAVATFSPTVLPLLWKYNRKLPLIDPSEEFLRTMTEMNNQDKIICVHLDAGRLKEIMRPDFANTFTNVKSLDISEPHEPQLIARIRIYFPKLTDLSLRYDGEIDFHKLYKIPNIVPSSVKRVNIHCASICCSHYYPRHLFVRTNNFNITLETFVLYVKHISGSLLNRCSEGHRKCVLRTIIDFTKIMSNIRRIRVITKGSIEKLLDKGEWKALVNACEQLKEIILRILRKTSLETPLVENIQEIENELHTIRTSIRFEVK